MASTIRQRRFNRPIIKGRIVKVMPSLAEKKKKAELAEREILAAGQRKKLRGE